MAHVPRDIILKMMRDKVVDGLQLRNYDHVCADCALNKCKRSSHPARSTPKATRPGQAIHMDTMGPINPPGLLGQRYVLVAKDEFSAFRMVACLKAKSSVSDIAKLMITKIIAQTGNEVLTITTDNGSEYINDSLGCFLQRRGIEMVNSVRYTPQQNGVAERENYTLIDQARVLINSAKLPRDLWPEAIMAATYISNRVLTSTRATTPHELWFGRKPNLNNLRVFGQHAAAMKINKSGKFDEKATRMRFVGYTDNHQTYKFFDPISNKIFMSTDAIFIDGTESLPLGEPSVQSSDADEQHVIDLGGMVMSEPSEEGHPSRSPLGTDLPGTESRASADLSEPSQVEPADTSIRDQGEAAKSSESQQAQSFNSTGSTAYTMPPNTLSHSDLTLVGRENQDDRQLTSTPSIPSAPPLAEAFLPTKISTKRLDYKDLNRGLWNIKEDALTATVIMPELSEALPSMQTL